MIIRGISPLDVHKSYEFFLNEIYLLYRAHELDSATGTYF